MTCDSEDYGYGRKQVQAATAVMDAVFVLEYGQ